MSVKLEARVWDLRGLPEHLKIVLARMSTIANDDGWVQIGQVSIADDVDRDERTIRRRMELLDRLGLLEKLRRHRRGDQEYRLHIPEDPGRMSWREPVSLLMKEPDIHLEHGWFNQDRPQVPGQASMLLDGLAPRLERPPVTGQPGGLDRTQDRSLVTPRPVTGDAKTGHGRPVPKDERREDARARRHRALDPETITEEEVFEIARERARAKGAYNLAALTRTIAKQDRDEIIVEILEIREKVAWSMDVDECDHCDSDGRVWYTAAGAPVAYDDPDADTAAVCEHPDL